jgi:flagellar hook-associated protein 2
MAISSTGIGSNLPVESIVTQLMAVERKPASLLEAATTTMKSQLSTYGQLQSYVSALQDKSRSMASTTLWSQTIATSSDATVASVTTGTNTAAGSYSLTVSQLAVAQTASSTAVPAKTHNVGQGKLTIELGSWTGDPATFGLKAGASSVTVDIGEGESSLAAVRDKINAAGAGVVATVIYDATGARLSIRSTDTGVANGFRISAEETAPGDDGASLSMFAFDPASGSGGMTENMKAQDAKAKLNGLDITSASNTLSDVADGLTIKLLKKSESPIDLSVAQDTESMKTAVNDFVKAYNDLSSFIQTQTKYNADSKTAGKLQGDRTVIGLQAQMREIIRGVNSSPKTLRTLSDAGIEVQKDGYTIAVNSKKLNAALADPAEMKKLMMSGDSANESTWGLISRFNSMATNALAAEGPLTTRQEGIQASIKRNNDRVADMEVRLAATEERIRKQYQTLDSNMAKLSALNSYVSTQLSSLG